MVSVRLGSEAGMSRTEQVTWVHLCPAIRHVGHDRSGRGTGRRVRNAEGGRGLDRRWEKCARDCAKLERIVHESRLRMF